MRPVGDPAIVANCEAMSTPVEPPNPIPSTPPDPSLIDAMIKRLRAEHDAAQTSTARAILLHELGILEELMGDEGAAARDQLGAVNAEPEYREPLERLLSIIERRQSYKNLGKLVDRLVRIAEEPDERSRALQEQAAYLADHEENLSEARRHLEGAVIEAPEDAAAWLALETVAGRLEDADLRTRALAARTELTEHPEWLALLLVDLAATLRTQGDTAGGREALERATHNPRSAAFLVQQAIEDYARREGIDELSATALETQADYISQAEADSEAGDALGVPRYRRHAVYAADAWLRAALAHRRHGNLDAAVAALDRALSRLPGEPALVHARLGAADAAGDTESAAAWAQSTLERGPSGPYAAALWLRIAEHAAAQGDASKALEAVGHALTEDAQCIPARALQLDLLASEVDPQALASALEATAEQLQTDEARARMYLVAAYVWANTARDAQGAKAALSQAGMYGAAPGVVARVARLLAARLADDAWFEESTRRLLAAGASDDEQCSLWFELGRMRLLRGDAAGAIQAFASLARAPGGEWLGRALRAYSVPLANPARSEGGSDDAESDSTHALLDLANGESVAATSRALKLLVARRTLLAGRLEDAERHLSELQAEDPSNLLSASALATVLRTAGKPARAAECLVACASAAEDGTLTAALQLEAGLLYWGAGDRTLAVECFNAACDAAPVAGGAVLGWALRAAEPDDRTSRLRALTTAEEADEPGPAHLERFALYLGQASKQDEARAALDAGANSALEEVSRAATLARAIWAPAEEDIEAQLGAWDRIARLSPGATALARAAAYLVRLRDGAMPTVLADTASQWAEADSDPIAALEWIGASMLAQDRDGEVQAREALATRLGPELRSAVATTARLVAGLTSDAPQPMLGGSDPMARLTDLELALPGCDPRRRAPALCNVGDALDEDSAPLGEALAGWNFLACGDLPAAESSFRRVTEAFPEDIIGWEGLRTVGDASGDRNLVAEACAALGDAVKDDSIGGELWEQAGLILLDELSDPARAEFAFARAVDRDISRAIAFDRLFRIVRAKKDNDRLLELVDRRLKVAEDPEEIAKMFWEQARALRKKNRPEDALAALENVTVLEPNHVGALALSGEIYITSGRFSEAAQNLARLATLDEAPRQQRLMSGVAAVDLYEKKLAEPRKGLAVLAQLYRSGLSTGPVRERLARAAARLQAWDDAVDVLEELMVERETSEGRIEAARLALAIHRDATENPAAAEAAVRRLLLEAPCDGEALDAVLEGVFPDTVTEQLLSQGRDALVEHLIHDPLQPESVDRLARIAACLGNPALRQASLGALVALGRGTPEIDQELGVLDERVAHIPQIAIDESALPDLCDPYDRGPIPLLMRELAATFADALGPGLTAFGVTKKDRVDPRAGLPLRNEIAAWAGALGVGEFDLYVGGQDPDGVMAVATERPAVVVGSNVSAPLRPPRRQAVARELFALRRGVTILRHRTLADVAALVVAACRLGGHELPSPHYAMLDQFHLQLSREMSRKVKKTLPDLAAAVTNAKPDPIAWGQAAISSLDRLAAVAAGDASYVLATETHPRGEFAPSEEAQLRAARLLAFVLSPTYLAVREQLGMGVR